jgi:hypothetical protein
MFFHALSFFHTAISVLSTVLVDLTEIVSFIAKDYAKTSISQ